MSLEDVLAGGALTLVGGVLGQFLAHHHARRRDSAAQFENWRIENGRLQLDVLIELQDVLSAADEEERTYRMHVFTTLLQAGVADAEELPTEAMADLIVGRPGHSRLEVLRARVQDDELRSLITDLLFRYAYLRIRAERGEAMHRDVISGAFDESRLVAERLGMLIRTLNRPDRAA